MSDQTERILTNCPRDCYDGCGMLVEKKGGRITRVLGNPDHPVSRGKLCKKCAVAYNGIWQDETARLLYPLQRVGPKGEGRFERIGWDAAAARIATELKRAIAERGPESIVHTHYSGTLSLVALLFPMRFFNRLGATEVDPDSICNAAGHAAWNLLFGSSAVGFDPRTAADARCILIWGANPAHSGPHTHDHWFAEASARKIVVDPLHTRTAGTADLHLKPRPGSDAALAFGMLHALRAQGHFDDAFIESHTVGYAELAALIEPCTPAWAEQQCGVPAAQIEEAAHVYGEGPSLLWAGQGVQRQRTGGNVLRAVGLLPALTGNVGRPGTGFAYLNSTIRIAGLDGARFTGAKLARSATPTISHMDLAEQLADSARFSAFFSWNTNPVASAPRQDALREALGREDLFSVVVDCFQTDTADYADIVLPAASLLEFDDLTYSYFHLNIGAQAQVREAMGESLPNQEIFRRLARAMGFEEPELYEGDASLITRALEEMGAGMDFAALKSRGWMPISKEPLQLYADLAFKTPSGKIEIASKRAEAQGLPRVPQPWADPPHEAQRYRLITPASDYRLNDSYANDPQLAARAGEASVLIHPEDARSLAVAEGDAVRLHNETGELTLQVEISDIAQPGTLVSYKGRWPKGESNRANVNALFDATRTDMGESSAVHSTEVRLSPAS